MIRLLTAAALLALAPAQEPERKFDLARHVWLKWKPGAYSMHRFSFIGPDTPPESTLTRRLESVREKDYTISDTHHQGFSDRNDASLGVPRFVKEEALAFPSGPRDGAVWEWDA